MLKQVILQQKREKNREVNMRESEKVSKDSTENKRTKRSK